MLPWVHLAETTTTKIQVITSWRRCRGREYYHPHTKRQRLDLIVDGEQQLDI